MIHDFSRRVFGVEDKPKDLMALRIYLRRAYCDDPRNKWIAYWIAVTNSEYEQCKAGKRTRIY